MNGGTFFIDHPTSLGNVTVDGPTSVLEVNAGVDLLSTGLVLDNAGTLTNSGTVSGPGDGVDSTTGGATVNNQAGALIQGGTGDAIHFNDGGTVVNNGRIQSSPNAFAGVFADGLAGSVTNSGSISGNSAGIFLNAGGTVNNLGRRYDYWKSQRRRLCKQCDGDCHKFGDNCRTRRCAIPGIGGHGSRRGGYQQRRRN